MKKFEPLHFSRNRTEFYTTLNQRVNAYFKNTNQSKHVNTEMVFKTIFMFTLYLAPYALIMSGIITNPWLALLLSLVMGLGIAGIGVNVMHDAIHGAYSKKPLLNSIMGYSMNAIGANAFNWKVQHNVLHHTYTNVNEFDEDVSPRGILRFNPHAPFKKVHKYQHIYAWFLYGLMTFSWVFVKDVSRLVNYQKKGLVQKVNASLVKEWAILIVSKIIYLGYALVLPMIILPFAWWQIAIGFFAAHWVAGFLLAIIFQPAHVTPDSVFPLPDEENNLENNWAIHQVLTTKNFAQDNFIFSWFAGGLNQQIEHHLFPSICHVHYRKIGEIVKATAHEFDLPYYQAGTFTQAIKEHYTLLKELGHPNPVLTQPLLVEKESIPA